MPGAPSLSRAQVPAITELIATDADGRPRAIAIPQEHALTLYVDKHELVTLMTLGSHPEWLALGYLRNQGLISRVQDVAAVQVDWDVGAAAVTTHHGIAHLAARTAQRIVTTGCGQGTAFAGVMETLAQIELPAADVARLSRSTLRAMLATIRAQHSVHRRAGSVHGCALFRGPELLSFVEDVGRHNALDTVAGWMWMHGVTGADKLFYTTGRLTSEMVMKAALMGVPIVVSRNGITHQGLALAQRLRMGLFGRAANNQFLCYCGFDRFDADALPVVNPDVDSLAYPQE